MLMFYAELIIQEMCDMHHQTTTESSSVAAELPYTAHVKFYNISIHSGYC